MLIPGACALQKYDNASFSVLSLRWRKTHKTKSKPISPVASVGKWPTGAPWVRHECRQLCRQHACARQAQAARLIQNEPCHRRVSGSLVASSYLVSR